MIPIKANTSSASIVLCRKHNVGAILQLSPIQKTGKVTTIPHDDGQITQWTAGKDTIQYIYPAPSLDDILLCAWYYGAYDIRIIIDIPRDLRQSGSIVGFCGRPNILDSNGKMDWSHIDNVDEQINWLIDACSKDGHYNISWRPNYGTHFLYEHRRKGLSTNDVGLRKNQMPTINVKTVIDRAIKIAPAEIVIRFEPSKIGKIQPIEWCESSRPSKKEEG